VRVGKGVSQPVQHREALIRICPGPIWGLGDDMGEMNRSFVLSFEASKHLGHAHFGWKRGGVGGPLRSSSLVESAGVEDQRLIFTAHSFKSMSDTL
jgi:hypothetical protein